MELPFKERTYLEVDYKDIEKFIRQEYGIEYEMISGEEWNNDSSHDFDVCKGIIDEYDQAKLNNWLNSNEEQWLLNTILRDLCNKDKIKEGWYLIGVSW